MQMSRRPRLGDWLLAAWVRDTQPNERRPVVTWQQAEIVFTRRVVRETL